MVAIAAYVFGLPLLQSVWHRHYHYGELILPRLIDVTVFLWLFWVGSSVGSFLNVVAWRMPRGESINGRSYCPRCQSRLAARDNFPVFGWLALGGRCRTCRLPISARYPIVEAIVGTCITAVGLSELYRISLPLNGTSAFGGPVWAPIISRDEIGLLLFHVVALSTSFAVGLIRFDNQRLPYRLICFSLAVTSIPILLIPSLAIVSWQVSWPMDSRLADDQLGAIVRVLCSMVGAAFFARTLSRGLCPSADPKLDPLGSGTARLLDLVVLLSIPAIIVGWQSLPAVIVTASLLATLVRRMTSRPALESLAIAIPLAMTIQLAAWRQLHHSGYWPSIDASPWTILAWSAAALTVPFWLSDSAAPESASDEEVNDDIDKVATEPSNPTQVDDPPNA